MKRNDYGWENNNRMKSQAYLLGPILREIKDNDCIIDVGCGNGAIANDLISAGYNVYGVDADSRGIEIARNGSEARRFYQIDIENGEIPYELKNLCFNVAISTEVIEHIYSPDNMMDFINDVLSKSDSKLIISTPYHGYIKNFLLSLTGQWDKHFTALWEGGHIKFWSRKTLTTLLENHGFKVIKFYGCGRLPFVWKSMVLVAERESKQGIDYAIQD